MLEKFPGVAVTAEVDKVLADIDVHAVIVATPVSTHEEIGLSALQAGKHLWVEKPLAASVAAASKLVQEASSRGLILLTDHLFVYNPGIAKIRELLSQGWIGTLFYAESGRMNLGPPTSEVDVIWDLAPHDLSISHYLWGQSPVEIMAVGRKFKHPQLIDVAFLHLQFADGSTAVHHVSWLCPEKVRRYFVAGTNGSLLFDDTQPEKKVRFVDQGIDSRIGSQDHETKELFYRPGEVSFPALDAIQPLRAACLDFLDCIVTGASPRANGEAGLAVIKMLEAAEFSITQNSHPVPIS